MPLDLKKVITQLTSLENQNTLDIAKNRIVSTYNLLQDAFNNQQKLLTKLIETRSNEKANFFFAIPELEEENISSLIPCDKNFSQPHIVVATDGSQINPSAHEFTNAFLINIGLTAIPYFNRNIPVLLNSEPHIYNSIEDINPLASEKRNFYDNVHEEDLVAYERTLQEVELLVKLAKKYTNHKLPIIALLDGTLIHWHIEKFNNAFIEHFIKRFTDALLELKSLNIPVASFLSNSRANDLINMLRIYKCPYDSVDCKKHCSDIVAKNLPCNPILDYKPIFDRKLVGKYFTDKTAEAGTRTVLFKSNSKILNHYNNELKILFFYINTGTEIARVEIPSYVAQDENLLTLLHNTIYLQCKVGFGYPVTLSESHLQAIVNRNDGQIFYELLKKELLKRKQTPITLSAKEFKKRISFV